MIKVENIDVWGFEHAIRGMRNPLNSWDKSDSYYATSKFCEVDYIIGDEDLRLMRKLYKAGAEHRKYGRYIDVYMDITAPLYWWKEWDTYKFITNPVYIDSNSCSTMHKIHSKEFELDDFSYEHLLDESIELLKTNIDSLNQWRNKYIIASKIDDIVGTDLIPSKKTIWWQMIQLLPSSYNQKRTIKMTYETVFDIIKQRTGHKLDEWRDFVKIIKGLPYIEEIIE